MSYYRYLCLLAQWCLAHIVVFFLALLHYVASFYGLSIFDCPFSILLLSLLVFSFSML
jgi:hypothetical protein